MTLLTTLISITRIELFLFTQINIEYSIEDTCYRFLHHDAFFSFSSTSIQNHLNIQNVTVASDLGPKREEKQPKMDVSQNVERSFLCKSKMSEWFTVREILCPWLIFLTQNEPFIVLEKPFQTKGKSFRKHLLTKPK